MKLSSFKIVVIFIFLSLGFLTAQLPGSIMNQYQRFISGADAGVQTGVGTDVETYKSPEITPYDTTQKYLKEVEKEKEPVVEPKFPWFFEFPIVIEGDTLQIIRKALPKQLETFGSSIFENIPFLSSSQLPVSDKYIIGSGDKLLINMWGAVNAQYDLIVDRDGKIYIPQIGDVAVGGIPVISAQRKVNRLVNNVFADVSISLTLTSIKTVQVFVVGNVENPGIFDLPGLSRVINAIAVAGGPSNVGSFRNIKVYRGDRLIGELDMYELILTGKAKGNIQLANGDLVMVPPYEKKVKLRGLVKNPAIFELIDDETMKDLINYSGWFLPNANIHEIFVDRINNGIHIAINIDFEDTTQWETILKDGDDISIFPVNPYRENVIFLEGYIPYPGVYGWEEGMTVDDLFDRAGMLYDDTYRERVDIFRLLPDESRELISVDLLKDSKVSLQPQDRIKLYSVREFLTPKEVSISGSVRKPGKYRLYEKMRVSDLIFTAGGVERGSYLDSVELVRITDGLKRERKILNLGRILKNPDSPENILLVEDDYLTVKKIPGWLTPEIVTIIGEVVYPGDYALLNEEETLSDLLERVGGFTPDAYTRGLMFIRPEIAKEARIRDIPRILRSTRPLILDSLGRIDTLNLVYDWQGSDLNRIIIDVSKIVSGEDDFILRAGDSIFVPRIPGGVSVLGAVGINGTVKYSNREKVAYYIKSAGGATKDADINEMRIVKMNGEVLKVSKGYRNVEPGDIIILPKKIKQETNWLNIMTEIVTVLTGLATTTYIIIKLK